MLVKHCCSGRRLSATLYTRENMEKNKNIKKRKLHRNVEFSLFSTSYIPLFFLIILRQTTQNWQYFNWGGFNVDGIINLIQNYGLSIILLMISMMGIIGIYFSIKNLTTETSTNGFLVTIKDVKNRNAEAISYIGTYIIPFLFQDYSDWYSFISITFLLFVVYKIYVGSSLLLINPLLNIRYSIYEFEYYDDNSEQIEKRGMLITKDKFLEDNEKHIIHSIGPKLYFGVQYEK